MRLMTYCEQREIEKRMQEEAALAEAHNDDNEVNTERTMATMTYREWRKMERQPA